MLKQPKFWENFLNWSHILIYQTDALILRKIDDIYFNYNFYLKKIIMSDKIIKNTFFLAGLINILGALILSMFFSNETLISVDSNTVSNSGLVLIIVWGLAFIATANHFKKNKWIVGVFALEKLTYVLMWCFWYFSKDYTMMSLFEKDFMTGFFYATFGLNDLLFFFFFTYVFLKRNN